MSNSHFPAEAWREIISDTVHGNAIDYTAKRIGCSHQAVFDMRHKVLLALRQLPEINDICLGEVSEFDETFVLDCYKGKEMDSSISRGPRRHGAKPSAKELLTIFEGHIADGTPALCGGLRSYHALPRIADCIVKDCNDTSAGNTCFYNLNTVNGFHSFIKHRYVFYRGVASKYINRYNALFSTTYRNTESIIKRLIGAVLTVTGTDYYHSNRNVREAGLLAI